MNAAERPVSQVMTAKVVQVSTTLPLTDALKVMGDQAISSVLVVEDGLLLGIVTERDVVRALHRSPSLAALNCADLMQSPVITVGADASCLEAYQLMAGRGIRHVAVTDAGERLVGVASEGDILRDLGIEYYMHFKEVQGVMATKLCLLPASATVGEAAARMDREGHSCVIAIDGAGRPAGILTERDVVRLCHDYAKPAELPLGQVMRAPVRTVRPQFLLHQAVTTMEEAGIRRLVVVDAEDRAIGLVTHHEVVKGLESSSYVSYLKELIERQAQELRENRAILTEKMLLDNILRSATGTAVIAADLDWRVIYCSAGADTVLDLPAAQARGRDLREILDKAGWDDSALEPTTDALRECGAQRQEVVILHDGAGASHLELQLSLLLDEGDTPQGYLLLAQDVGRWDAAPASA